MATTAENKIDAAAEKAYAEAAAKKAATAKAAEPEVTPVAAPKAAAPAKAEVAASAKPAPAKKAAAPKKAVAAKKAAVRKPAVKKAAAKPSAKKAAAKPAATKTPAIKKAATKKPVAQKDTAAAAKTPTKETIMTKAKTQTADMTAKLKEGLADLQTRAKTFYGKGTELASEMGEFTKGNAEAVVESGKILASGVQEIAKAQFEDGKTAVETMTADVKEFVAVKSPTEFVQLQGKIVSRNFDATVAQVSKTTEMWVKLANDSFAPISSRVSVAMEKVRKAA